MFPPRISLQYTLTTTRKIQGICLSIDAAKCLSSVGSKNNFSFNNDIHVRKYSIIHVSENQ